MIAPKRILKLKDKECQVCGERFMPASGAQMTCSPECKVQAKARGLTKRGPRSRDGVDPAVTVEENASGSVRRSLDTAASADLNSCF